MIKDASMRITKKGLNELSSLLHELHKYRDKYFGNARTVRKIILDVIKNQNLRFAQMNKDIRSPQKSTLISHEDVLKLDILSEKSVFDKKGIGFDRG